MTPVQAAPALEGLREIPLPSPVSYMPQTAGWFVLLAILLVVLILLAVRWRRSWVENRYKRQALAELATLEQTAEYQSLPGLVKRTVLASAPRETVAALSGREWLEYLDATDGSRSFTQGPGRLLPELAYGTPQVSETEVRELFALVRGWVRRRRARI